MSICCVIYVIHLKGTPEEGFSLDLAVMNVRIHSALVLLTAWVKQAAKCRSYDILCRWRINGLCFAEQSSWIRVGARRVSTRAPAATTPATWRAHVRRTEQDHCVRVSSKYVSLRSYWSMTINPAEWNINLAKECFWPAQFTRIRYTCTRSRLNNRTVTSTTLLASLNNLNKHIECICYW